MKEKRTSKEKSFEESLARLEEIISQMEEGNLSLDATLKKFEEGIRLAQFCSRKLDEAEKKFEILIKEEDGSFETREFPPSEELVPDTRTSEQNDGRDEEVVEEEADEENEPLF